MQRQSPITSIMLLHWDVSPKSRPQNARQRNGIMSYRHGPQYYHPVIHLHLGPGGMGDGFCTGDAGKADMLIPG